MSDRDPRAPTDGLPTESHGVALTEPKSEPATSPGQLRLYVATLMLAPFLFLLACLAVIRTKFFIRHDQNVYLANMGYGANLRNADCKILIYGDSSAMVGIDPGAVQRATGLSTCNIAEAAGMTMVNGTMILDEYLSHNRPPRYLVFLFAPENLAPITNWKSVGYFEAVLIRMRHLDPDFLRIAFSHAEEVLGSLEMTGRFALTWAPHKPLPPSLLHDRESNRGRLDAPGQLLTGCDTQTRENPPSRAWTDSLRRRYTTHATTVLIDVTPVPTCDPTLPVYRTEFATEDPIIDNNLQTYPLDAYTQNGRLHMSPKGIAALSGGIADQINQHARTEEPR